MNKVLQSQFYKLDTGFGFWIFDYIHVHEHINLIFKILNTVITNSGEYVSIQVDRRVLHDASKCYGEERGEPLEHTICSSAESSVSNSVLIP